MYIVFENSGEVDMTAFTSFGVSVKEKTDAIGFYGTGSSYAVSIFLRNNVDVEVLSGEESFVFSTETQSVRGKPFEFVTMNGEKLGYTLHLGHTWESWMGYRELYCNALDEGGRVYKTKEKPLPEKGVTKVVLKGQEALMIFDNHEEYFLNTEKEPLFEDENVSVFSGSSNFVYYQGIRAMKLDKPSMNTYNIKSRMELTEDRTIKYTWTASCRVAACYAYSCADEKVLNKVLTADIREFWEGSFDYESKVISEHFIGVVNKLAKTFVRNLNESAVQACKIKIGEVLPKESVKMTTVEERRLKKAVDFLTQIGYGAVEQYPIIVADTLGKDVLGRAANETIYISKKAFAMGTKILAGTIYEEFVHLHYGLDDCDRSMQNFLIDAIMSVGELVVDDML